MLDDLAFDALLELKMCVDPTPLSPALDAAFVGFLNRESVERGHEDWVAAIHERRPA